MKASELEVGKKYFDKDNRKVIVIAKTNGNIFFEGVSYYGCGGTGIDYAENWTLKKKLPPEKKEEEREFDRWVEYLDCDEHYSDEGEKNHWMDGYNWAKNKIKG